ncbi:hypothetical protein [Burkholderia sp. LMG 32019]|uniref:hypothetical protein n=1 Tax=Burkholderia sp. LMG 32019 TaxID=3158173 RepID=UPI003C2BC36A
MDLSRALLFFAGVLGRAWQRNDEHGDGSVRTHMHVFVGQDHQQLELDFAGLTDSDGKPSYEKSSLFATHGTTVGEGIS